MARDFGEKFSLFGITSQAGSIRITKNVMDMSGGVRTTSHGVKALGVRQLRTPPNRGSCGVLETLSPEMARDLGDAFSLDRIGSRRRPRATRDSATAARGALRFAGRIAVFVLVAVVAVSFTLTAMYLLPMR